MFKKNMIGGEHPVWSIRVLVILLVFLTSLSVILAACGGPGSGPGSGAGSGEEETIEEPSGQASEMEEEREVIQQAIKDYMERTGATEVPPRENVRVIGPWDENVPFKGDIPAKLPTTFKYAWDAEGNITEVSQE